MRKPILQVAREGIMPTGFPTVVNQHFFNPAPGRVPRGNIIPRREDKNITAKWGWPLPFGTLFDIAIGFFPLNLFYSCEHTRQWILICVLKMLIFHLTRLPERIQKQRIEPLADAKARWPGGGSCHLQGRDDAAMIEHDRTLSGWWFPTWMDYFSMGIMIPTDELICFRGVGKPPTSFFLALELDGVRCQGTVSRTFRWADFPGKSRKILGKSVQKSRITRLIVPQKVFRKVNSRFFAVLLAGRLLILSPSIGLLKGRNVWKRAGSVGNLEVFLRILDWLGFYKDKERVEKWFCNRYFIIYTIYKNQYGWFLMTFQVGSSVCSTDQMWRWSPWITRSVLPLVAQSTR